MSRRRAPKAQIRTLRAPTVGERSFARSARTAQRRAARKQTARGPRAGLADRLRRVPLAAWVCALVAFLNAASWSVISPPFQIPDEPSHFEYVQRLAETGKLPSSGAEKFPRSEYTALSALHYFQVRFHPEHHTISSQAEQHTLERALANPLERTASIGAAGVAASQPPLYYALQTIPFALGSIGTLLDQLALMRLLSALIGGITGLFAYLFLREALPGARWAWTVGGLGVALMPLFGMMSGAVNPDAMLYAVSAALFYCLARGFRRGLTPNLATALGAILAIGLVTKLNFLGLLPGALLGLLVLCLRVARTSTRTAYRCLALALGLAASPLLLYVLLSALAGRSALGPLSSGISLSGNRSIPAELSYIWQLYLPRLPGMTPHFHGLLTTHTLWFDGLVGFYGWLDTTFPHWVYSAALLPAGLIAVLLIRELVTNRRVLPSRALELAVYAVIALGVLLLIGADDYVHGTPGEYAEPRYLLPMLVLWGAVLALAARGAGRRWGPVVGVLIVTLVLAHDIFSQLLVISRYYG
jgi:hypothetical protein